MAFTVICIVNALDANDRLVLLHRAEARNRERLALIHHSEDSLRAPTVPEADTNITQNPGSLNGLCEF